MNGKEKKRMDTEDPFTMKDLEECMNRLEVSRDDIEVTVNSPDAAQALGFCYLAFKEQNR